MTLIAVDDAAQAVVDRLDGGFLRVFEGQNMLAEMRFADPAFGPVADGRATAYPLTVGRARRGGVAASFAALDRDGTPVLFGKVGDTMMLKPNTGIDAGAEVTVASFTYRQGAE